MSRAWCTAGSLCLRCMRVRRFQAVPLEAMPPRNLSTTILCFSWRPSKTRLRRYPGRLGGAISLDSLYLTFVQQLDFSRRSSTVNAQAHFSAKPAPPFQDARFSHTYED